MEQQCSISQTFSQGPGETLAQLVPPLSSYQVIGTRPKAISTAASCSKSYCSHFPEENTEAENSSDLSKATQLEGDKVELTTQTPPDSGAFAQHGLLSPLCKNLSDADPPQALRPAPVPQPRPAHALGDTDAHVRETEGPSSTARRASESVLLFI